MREVTVEAVVEADPDTVFADLADFPGYVHRAPSVRQVVMGEGNATSSWEVSFRDGILRWVEADVFDPVARTIDFRQTEGDMELFEGSWLVEPAAQGACIVFTARFDLGVPGLATFLEPVAQRALEENIAELLRSLFADAAPECMPGRVLAP
jgi:ribosome-associated toxin RatA of RatAB toxin-antitoxin module